MNTKLKDIPDGQRFTFLCGKKAICEREKGKGIVAPGQVGVAIQPWCGTITAYDEETVVNYKMQAAVKAARGK